MKITWLDDVEPRARRVALGQFDGVHLGHRRLIAGCDTVVTFDPHPQAVLAPDRAPALLSPLHRKAELMARLHVEELVVIPFDRERAAQSAEDFVTSVLVDALGTTQVSVGENFRFGHRAAGDPGMLARDPRLTARIVPLLHVGGAAVASTRVRGLVADARVEEAALLLGSPVYLAGQVRWATRSALGTTVADVAFAAGQAIPAAGTFRCHGMGRPATLTIGPAPDDPPLSGRLVGDLALEVGETIGLELSARVDAGPARRPAAVAAA